MNKCDADKIIGIYVKKLFGFAVSKLSKIDEAEELAELCWSNLNENNKVSLFVRQIPLDGTEPTEIIINKNK